MMTDAKRAHIVNKLFSKIDANPASFTPDFIQEAERQNPEFAKPRRFAVLNSLNEVICELTTTPTGAREVQVHTDCSVIPIPG